MAYILDLYAVKVINIWFKAVNFLLWSIYTVLVKWNVLIQWGNYWNHFCIDFYFNLFNQILLGSCGDRFGARRALATCLICSSLSMVSVDDNNGIYNGTFQFQFVYLFLYNIYIFKTDTHYVDDDNVKYLKFRIFTSRKPSCSSRETYCHFCDLGL